MFEDKETPTQPPLCCNQKEAKLVCLNAHCQEYPFFCSDCEDSSCEIPHQHEDKLTSVSFKEFTRRVFRERAPIAPLSSAMQSYKKVLSKLQEDVTEFIRKQMTSLSEMQKRLRTVPEEDQNLISKIKQQKYSQVTGREMDDLWNHCSENSAKTQTQEETAEFIRVKEEQIRGISQQFQHLNKLNFEEDEPIQQIE